jgi:hypothetical protein
VSATCNEPCFLRSLYLGAVRRPGSLQHSRRSSQRYVFRRSRSFRGLLRPGKIILNSSSQLNLISLVVCPGGLSHQRSSPGMHLSLFSHRSSVQISIDTRPAVLPLYPSFDSLADGNFCYYHWPKFICCSGCSGLRCRRFRNPPVVQTLFF